MASKERSGGWAVWIVLVVIGAAFLIGRSSNNSSAVTTPEPAAAAVVAAEPPREPSIEEKVAGLTAGQKLSEVRLLAKEGLTKARAGAPGSEEAYAQAERILATIPNNVAEGPEARQWERELRARRQLVVRPPIAPPQPPSIATLT